MLGLHERHSETRATLSFGRRLEDEIGFSLQYARPIVEDGKLIKRRLLHIPASIFEDWADKPPHLVGPVPFTLQSRPSGLIGGTTSAELEFPSPSHDEVSVRRFVFKHGVPKIESWVSPTADRNVRREAKERDANLSDLDILSRSLAAATPPH